MNRNANLSELPEIRPNVNGLEFDPILEHVLKEAPVTRISLPYGYGTPWLISRAADVAEVTKDRSYTRSGLVDEVPIPRLMPSFVPPSEVVQRQDDPRVSDMRKAMGKGINHKRMLKLRTVAEEIVSGLLDEMGNCTGTVDVFDAFTGRLPLEFMARLIDIPVSDCANIRQWTQYLFSTRDEEVELTHEAEHSLGGYSAGLVKNRMENPGRDMLSRMIADSKDKFTFKELVGMVIQLIAIGIAPSNSLLSNILYLILTDDQVASIRKEPARIDHSFDELCRIAPVIQGFGPPLIATKDTYVGGVSIKRGDVVVYSYSTANRDPAAFDNPDSINLESHNVNHFTFGSGIHACVAEHFSRLIVTTAVRAFFGRFPAAALAVNEADVDWDNGTIWRFPVSLPINLHG